MKKSMEIGIIGLGLIGGSIAKSLKAGNRQIKIIAHDICMADVYRAVSEKVADCAAEQPGEAFCHCDLIFICTPVPSIAGIMHTLSPNLSKDCLLVDTGSSKIEVMDIFASLNLRERFIGGHPMAGSEKSGYAASRANLFENAWFVLTPFPESTLESIQRVADAVSVTGAIPVVLEAEIHDKAVAYISHLPHIIAALLVTTVAKADDDNEVLRRLAAGGFKDITRIASSSPELWAGICLSNRKSIISTLAAMRDAMGKFSLLLAEGNYQELLEEFSMGKNWRDELSDIRKLRIPGGFEITVEVEDKPGIIADIAAILAKKEINIKNIGINNVREDDEGALAIRFETADEVELAEVTLSEGGYNVKRRR